MERERPDQVAGRYETGAALCGVESGVLAHEHDDFLPSKGSEGGSVRSSFNGLFVSAIRKSVGGIRPELRILNSA
jgi:hypothetical protein